LTAKLMLIIACDAGLQAIAGRYRKLVEIFDLGKVCAA